jgi:MerR family copper efflux transcriptional regulator
VREAKPLKIGQVAQRAGVGIETLRFYERQGLIQEPPRSESGYRQYPEDTVARLSFIQRAKDVGFSLGEIKEFIALRLNSTTSISDIKSRAEAKIAEIEAKLQDLKKMKTALVKLAGACDGTALVSECPILLALDKEDED